MGFEVAKNMILTGGKQVSIYDPTIVKIEDCGSNFYLTEAQVGKMSRADASISQLKELNPFMNVNVVTGPINKELLSQYSVVFVTELILPWADILSMNQFCRSQTPAIGFILSLNMGLYGNTFVDFGPKFIVKDTTGENPSSYIVVHVSQGNPGVVRVHEDKKHSFNDGDYVRFREVEGMTDLNDMPPMQVKVIDKHSFSIGDTSKFKDYIRGGVVEGVKMPVEVTFKPLADSLEQPLKSDKDFLINADLRLFGRAEQLHIGFCAIIDFYAKHGSLPEVNNMGQANEVVEIAKKMNEDRKARKSFSVEKIEEDVVRNMARFARTQITTMTSFFGGVAAQEGFKTVGKYNPIQQWFHYDCFETLPPETVNRKPVGSRYDDTIAIYGQETLAKLRDLKMLMVGAGALGCEFVKAFALLGITTNSGNLVLTDNDHIELSNLSRQFLFRQKDIGQPKSQVAVNVAVKMNPAFRAKAMKEYVSPSTEHIFTEDFWDDLDIVIGAVDNIKARMYIDSKCVWHHKAFLDSGTLGTKANTQVVIPKLTQSYADTMDPQEESFPMCTIRNFPNLIEHTIEWGRSQFEGLFGETPKNAAEYVKSSAAFMKRISQATTISGTIEAMKNIMELIKLKKKNSFEDCIAFAREKFQDHFNYTIAQLLHTFPPDYKDEHGVPFWTGPKRAPQILEFDSKDDLHIMYVQALAIIMAGALKIPVPAEKKSKDYITKIASKVSLPPFVPKKVTITVDDKQPAQEQLMGNEEEELAKLKDELGKLTAGMKEDDFEPVDFEKDDETNFHVDYVHATANLRARNYKIPECDKLKTRGIAGRIIPAIATSTAMIVGCMCNEIFKVIQKFDKIELYKNAFVNLALPMFVFSEPAPALKIKSKEFDPVMGGPVQAVPEGHTKWERIEIKGPIKLEELINQIQKQYNVEITMVVCGELPIYMAGMSPKERLGKIVESIVEEVAKSKLGPTVKTLRLDVMGETVEKRMSAVMPGIKYWLAPKH